MKKLLFLTIISLFILSCGGTTDNDSPCQPECQSWESCNEETTACEVSIGRCGDTSDCRGNLVCDNHLCVKPLACDPTCEEWETCKDDNKCETSTGRCTEKADCADGESCGADHKCVTAIASPFHLLAETVEFNSGDTMTIPTNVHGSVALFSKYPISVGILNDEAKELTINSITLTYGDRVMEEEFSLIQGVQSEPLVVDNEVIPANGRFDFSIKFYPVASHERTATMTITYNTDKTFVINLTGEGGSNANFSTPTRTSMDKVLGGADLDEMISGSVTDASGNTYFWGNDKMIAGADGFNNDIIIGQIKADGTLGWLKVWFGPKHDLSIDPGQNGESGGSSNSITMDDEGNIYVVGVTTKGIGSNYAALVIKLKPTDGSILWEKVWRPEFRTSQIAWQRADAYAVDTKGDYVYVAGSTLDNAAVMFLALKKSDGSLFFNKAFDLSKGTNDRAFALKVDDNGNAYMGGSMNGKAMLIKVKEVNTATPSLEWVKAIDAGVGSNVNSMDMDPSGNIYISVDVRGAATSFTFLKVDPTGTVIWGNENASSGQKNNIYTVRYLDGSVYAGGRVGIGEIDGVVGYDTQFGDGYLIKANADTGAMDWSLFYYSGKGTNEIAGYFLKGLGLANNKLYVVGHMWAKSGDRYLGYWYDGVQPLTSYAPAFTDTALLADSDLVDHIDLSDAEVQDASDRRDYIDAPMGELNNNGDKRKFTFSDSKDKNKGYGPDNDLSFTVLDIQ